MAGVFDAEVFDANVFDTENDGTPGGGTPPVPPGVRAPDPILRWYPDTRELEVMDAYSPKTRRGRRRYT